jgi:hypothetical protein
MRLTRKRMRNTTNRIFAIPAEAAASPENPRNPAMSAIIRNTTE